MKMQDWVEKLDAFLLFNDYEVLKDAGKVSAEVAKALAEGEYQSCTDMNLILMKASKESEKITI
ncbi:RhuM family protein [Wolbachia endosymbiont (group A) of Agelastica alni]|uniref:RhuM family protein n=1 Tax=Wolbachia endosymbiont (group A) of Agelastica alni TaxID=3066130 RepID=UPI003342A92D